MRLLAPVFEVGMICRTIGCPNIKIIKVCDGIQKERDLRFIHWEEMVDIHTNVQAIELDFPG